MTYPTASPALKRVRVWGQRKTMKMGVASADAAISAPWTLGSVMYRDVGLANATNCETSSSGQKRGSTTGQSTLITGHDLRDELEGLVDQWGNQRSSEAITCETSSRASLPTAMASSIQGLDRRLQPHPPSWPPSWRSGVEDFLSEAAVGFFD